MVPSVFLQATTSQKASSRKLSTFLFLSVCLLLDFSVFFCLSVSLTHKQQGKEE